MAPIRPRAFGLLNLFLLALLAIPTNALYFYMDGASSKCFFEELPKDTMVVGHYDALEYNDQSKGYSPSSSLSMLITVDEVFDDNHRIVSQRGAAKGRFTFSAADSGEHRLCFTPLNAQSHGWLSGGAPLGGIKFIIDMAIGDTSQIESNDKDKIKDIVQRVKDLNGRLQDIRREQVFQREREAEFRDQSESTNARVVRWTLIQLVVLGVTCAWQLSHLRSFFIKQKLT